MTTQTSPPPARAGLVQTVKSIVREALDQETAAIDRARLAYPKLIEMEDADPRHVVELREAMRLLGKTPADLTGDLATIREGRRLQDVIRQGNGLDGQRQAAADALDDHRAETARIIEERKRQHFDLMQRQNELEGLHSNAARAFHELTGLRERNPDVLRYVERIDRN